VPVLPCFVFVCLSNFIFSLFPPTDVTTGFLTGVRAGAQH